VHYEQSKRLQTIEVSQVSSRQFERIAYRKRTQLRS